MENKTELLILKDKMDTLLLKNSGSRLRSPLIIELSGSPKSGKTTIIKQFESFFKEYGFRTYSVIEKASISSITNKQSPDFNMWTMLRTCIDMLEISESKKYDIIFIDRGVFDSLCWFKWHIESNKLEKEVYDSIENFILLQRWVREINLVFVFVQNSQKTIARDSHKLFNETGSILNESVLNKYNECVKSTYKNHKDKFRHVEMFDTTPDDNNDIRLNIGVQIIDLLEKKLNEQIGYFSWDELSMDTVSGVFSISHLLKKKLHFQLRSEVESGVDYQPIPCAVILNETGSRIFVTKKSTRSLDRNSPELDKYLLWSGGHVREDDMSNSYTTFDTLKNTLHREIREETGLDIKIKDEESFCVYTPTNEKSKQHIAICFVIRVNEFINMRQDDNELLPKYGNSKYGKFHNIEDFENNFNSSDFEEWSQHIGYKLGLFSSLQTTFPIK